MPSADAIWTLFSDKTGGQIRIHVNKYGDHYVFDTVRFPESTKLSVEEWPAIGQAQVIIQRPNLTDADIEKVIAMLRSHFKVTKEQ